MGNRATLVFTDGKERFSPAVYLHWNGGPESIYSFLAELDRRHVRADQDYEAARFIQIVGEFFDQEEQGGLSLGVANGPRSVQEIREGKIETDLSDNGVYLVQREEGAIKMRRFLLAYNKDAEGNYIFDNAMIEKPDTWVARERKEFALADAAAFAETFTKIAGERPVSQYE